MRSTSVLIFVLLSLISSRVDAQIPEPFWDHGPFDLDGPLGPPPPTTVTLYSCDFDPGCDPDTWADIDASVNQTGFFFHVDNFAGLPAPYSPIFGAQSLWCGARSESSTCLYATLPGYGNKWDEYLITRDCLSVTGFVSCTFAAKYDMEAPNDKLLIEYDRCDDVWTTLGTLTGSSGFDYFGESVAPADHSGNVRFRLRFVSDEAGSDEDGFYDSNGAIIIDDLRIDDDNGIALAAEDFESSGPINWVARFGGFGSHLDLFNGYELVQEDPVAENLTKLWAFINNSTDNYACGGWPAQAAVPFGPREGRYIHNEVRSPVINFTGPFDYSTSLKFDVYRDLPRDNLVFYTWRVRELLNGSDCWSEWRSDGLNQYSDRKEWHVHEADLTPYLSPAPFIDAIQVALGVIDMAGAWTGIFGSGNCHSHAPLFDNVEVVRRLGRSAEPRSLTLFQDRFPGNGTLQGTVRVDGVEKDFFTIKITEPSIDIDYLIPNTPASGPAVLLHVKNVGNKSGAVISGGQQWPFVQNSSDTLWTAIQMSEGSNPHEYDVDLNDDLYTPGDVIEYYVSSRDMYGIWSYWTHSIGSTTDLASARKSPMEMTCLPRPQQQLLAAGSFVAPRGLYIDGCSGLGAQPLIENSMSHLGVVWDRFDRNEPLQDPPNGLGNLLTNPAFLQEYDFVIWNTGDLVAPFRDEDYIAMLLYLDGTPGARLFISGDHAARAIAESSDPAAIQLRSQFINFDLVTDDHRSLGLPVTPLVWGVPNTAFEEEFFAYGGDGATFDVVTPTGGAMAGMYYLGSSNWGALIHQNAIGSAGAVQSVLATFSMHWIRDDQPESVPDRTLHLDDVLNHLGTPGGPVSGAGTADSDFLSQNHPNPFNPSTTIEYSLSRPGALTLRIYDVSGGLVRTLVDEPYAVSGPGRVLWDGRNNAGVAVASGVYFYRLAAGDRVRTRKMVLLK